MTAIDKFIQNIRARINGINSNTHLFPLPTELTDWTILAQRLPAESQIWIHIGIHNNTCYALRMGASTVQNPFSKQWLNGPNALRHVLASAEDPPLSLMHNRANEVYFYRQSNSLFTEQHLLFLYTNSLQSTVINSIMSQIKRHCRPFFSRAHPIDGASLFGSEAFTTRLVTDVILNRNRVTIKQLLPESQSDPSNLNTNAQTLKQNQTPPSILFSAFVLSLRRIVKDDTQWDNNVLIGQLQGHDPHGNPLILGCDSERSLVKQWLQLVPRMPKQSPWHYEKSRTGHHFDLFLPKMIRNGFGPRVSVISAKDKSEQYRIIGLNLFCPSMSKGQL